MKIFKKTLITATLLLSITSAQAAFVESDWKNAGDALATLDTETGIEWLDLTQTDGMSINDAEALRNSTFSGWRFPTRAEVTQMMVSTFPSRASLMQGSGRLTVDSPTTDNEADRFRQLFGITGPVSSYSTYSYGMFKNDSDQADSVILSGMYDRTGDNHVLLISNEGATANSTASNDYDYKTDSRGIFLVSDGGTTLSSQNDPSINANNANAPINDVSAPALLGLMSLGLFGFAARRRNAK
jgi:hypothetical protein